LVRYQWFAYLVSIALLALVSPARATVIAWDNFESYTAGSQLENSAGTGLNGGGGWTGAYNINDSFRTSVKVASLSLNYANGAVSMSGGQNVVKSSDAANSTELISRPFTSQTGTVYFSFLYRTNNPITSEDFLQIGLSDAATGEPKVSVGTANNTDSTPPSVFFVRVPTGQGNSSATSIMLNPDHTYLVVGKASKVSSSGTYNQIDLFLDPNTLTESTPTSTRTVTANFSGTVSSLSNLIVRTARVDIGDIYYFDNFTIGDSYASVVPEPSSLALVAGLAGLLCHRPRRRPSGV
jgi:hypothetical protein